MPFFAFVYWRRSRLPVNFIRSFCHYIIPLFLEQSFVCYVEPLGSDGNKIDSDSESTTIVTSVPPMTQPYIPLSSVPPMILPYIPLSSVPPMILPYIPLS